MTTSIENKLKRLRSQSNHPQHKHSAVITYRGRPVSFGFNEMRTHPGILKFSKVKLIHAEMSAILKDRYQDFTGCTMTVYREDRDGNMAMSRPCEVCLKMLRAYGFKNIMFSTKAGWKEEIL